MNKGFTLIELIIVVAIVAIIIIFSSLSMLEIKSADQVTKDSYYD